MKNNQLIHFRNAIYKLSKDYSFPVDLYRATEVTNYRTGLKTLAISKWHVKKALLLPNRMFREYSYLGFNSPTQQVGGLFDIHERRVLIDKKQLPRNHVIEENDYLIFNHQRFEFKDISEMEIADFWHLTLRKIEGRPNNEIHEYRFEHRLKFVETVLHE